jgi:hypothetical protein
LDFAPQFSQVIGDRGEFINVNEHARNDWERIWLSHAKPCISLNLPVSLIPIGMIGCRTTGTLVIDDNFKVRGQFKTCCGDGIADYVALGNCV